jgi:CBS domain-containing protein
MKRVSDILSRKGRTVISVPPATIVFDALKMMADQNIGSVAVLDGTSFLGIMTERDYSRKITLKGKSSTDTRVSDIMSTDWPRVTPNDTIDYCMQLLTERNIRYLPVFDGDEICGIISINDVVKEVIISQKETITHLTDYLHSNL